MILQKIILTNFGVYGGWHEIDVGVKDPEKTIVLIGALNGAGKTTILDALQLVFFGAKAPCSGREGQSYSNYLKQSINNGVSKEEGASVEVQFSRTQDGTLENYELLRSWAFKKGNLKEKFLVCKNGIPHQTLSKSWENYVDTFLPIQVASLFLFDGEKIKDLATPERSGEILKTALFNLLGLDLVEKLNDDLSVFKNRLRGDFVSEGEKEKLTKIKEDLILLTKEKSKLVSIMEQNLEEVIGLRKEIQKCKEKLRVEGYDYFKDREKLEITKEELEQKCKTLQNEIRELAAGNAPLFLVKDLVQRLRLKAESAKTIKLNQEFSRIYKKKNQELLSRLEGFLGEGEIERLKQILKSQEEDFREPTKTETNFNLPEGVDYLVSRILEFEKALGDRAKSLKIKLEISQIQLEDVQKRLFSVPDEERIKPITKELKTFEEKIIQNEQIQTSLEKEKKQIEFKIEEAKRAVSKSYDRTFELWVKNEKITRKVKFSDLAKEKLEEFKNKMVLFHLERIEKEITERFNKLHRKKGFIKSVKIDPKTFEVLLKNQSDEFIQMKRLSAGERQVLAISILWALAKTSGIQMPTVIDTPLGRLDSEHRSTLLEKYFPEASNQVILLSTDKEIVGRDKEKLDPHLAHSYLVEFCTSEGRSRIEKGYFGVEK